MELHERIIEQNREEGIVPMLIQQAVKYHRCEDCGKQIDPYREGATGRWMDEGEAKVYPENTNPVYAHVICPEDE